ncbi:CHASE3 domain-containing protein [Methyloferula stellata]|uniref:CHASE3 domain-containing protein n=1 Tax=Methyloferula stellata TaxID=876270 RepID=UPI000364E4BE|nr:CHASE3 domain-containing protein [Methyloferula stellata]
MPALTHVFLRMFSLIAGFLALGLIVGASLWLSLRQAEDTAALRSSVATESSLAAVLSALQDVETGQRGFLLTGQERYLEPFNNGRENLERQFEVLSKELSGHASEIPLLSTLHSVAQQRLEIAQAGIEAKDDGKLAVVINSDRGKVVMDRARELIAEIRAEEARLIDERSAAADAASSHVRIGILSAAVLVVVLGLLSFWINQRQVATLLAARDALSAANVNLVREAQERERLSDQLRQAQKMEAVGQLTGGIAHDFNNMLAIVIGSLNLLKRRLDRGETSDAAQLMDSALEGATRAAGLTNRLLAFSRQQALTPEPIDPNKFVSGLSDLLRRTLGEAIQIEIVLAGGLWKTHADANQLESAILNLCINARDAMPDGGKLTIETLNAYLDETYAAEHVEVPAGQYVLIAITDTGMGMPSDVVSRAFDPFFTTKEIGKGTGLGLSQVFGFVKQSGGHIKIYSEVGQGTTVKLYLPRFLGSEQAAVESARPNRAAGNLSESVLVVEDEDRVRSLTVGCLRELGYTVHHADGAAAALRILDADPAINLLFTDIVMPEINGRKLADEALRRRPKLKVLFTTGYTRNAIVHNGVLDPGVHLIGKPFTLDQLAAKVRDVLDGA